MSDSEPIEATNDGLDDLQAVFAPAQEPSEDQIANREASSLAAGLDLEQDGQEREHARHQKFRDNINKATLWIFWMIAISLLLGVATYAWHLMTPETWHYLTEKQLDKLQTLLGSAVLSSALTGYVNRRMA